MPKWWTKIQQGWYILGWFLGFLETPFGFIFQETKKSSGRYTLTYHPGVGGIFPFFGPFLLQLIC